ncbi:hypothetical protein D5086_017814 [Populus alba]|uniref:Uncharacterized protein n=1 Tax=Populus alba TaxID=43335 RepID=A0ACC4BND5_POPAL
MSRSSLRGIVLHVYSCRLPVEDLAFLLFGTFIQSAGLVTEVFPTSLLIMDGMAGAAASHGQQLQSYTGSCALLQVSSNCFSDESLCSADRIDWWDPVGVSRRIPQFLLSNAWALETGTVLCLMPASQQVPLTDEDLLLPVAIYPNNSTQPPSSLV